MPAGEPFILLDDARSEGAVDAHLFEHPSEIFVARRAQDVPRILAEAEAARIMAGGILAGYIAYEAGLALEPRLMPLATERTGAHGPLVWLALFEDHKTIPADEVPRWLAERAGAGPASIGPLVPQISTGAYLEAFAALQEAIRAGDIYQSNMTFPLAGAARGDPVAIYSAIRPAAKAGYGGLVFDGDHWLLSFSPELFFALKDGKAKVKPMKGTRPRGRTPEEDAELRDELGASAKDKAENLMIVDLLRNDLSRVAEPGSVRVDDPFTIETYPTVHTMVSTIRAQLQPDKGTIDMIRALFPCGSITGAPKIRAMELIHQLERDARGPYCGAIGRIGPGKEAAFNVAIRTIRLTPGENDKHHAVLGVGGAIVADSDGMGEWRECLIKGGFVRGEAGGHDLIETMRFDPEGGIPLLELHLERIGASARELGFAFDRHEARNRIHALCFEIDAPAKLRLLLSRGGEIALETGPLPQPANGPVTCIALPCPVVSGDWRLRHKSTDRSFYEEALASARESGATEAILVREDGLVTEGSVSNLFVEREGKLLTPAASLGLLPGVLRAKLIAEGRAQEAQLTLADLAGGFFIGNATRGLLPAILLV